MDNPQDISPLEPISQPAPTSGIEWGAIGIGIAAGVAWWVAQTAFWRFFFVYVGANYGAEIFRNQWFSWFNTALRYTSPLAYGTVIGFIVGYRARHHPYWFTFVVIVLLFLLTTAFSLIMFGYLRGFLFSFSYMLSTAFGFLLSLAAALNGVFLAQSVKRNRHVQIQ